MTTKLEQALKDLEATCEDLADLDEAFKRGRLQGLEEAKVMADEIAKYVGGQFADTHRLNTGLNHLRAAIREKIRVGAQEENTQ